MSVQRLTAPVAEDRRVPLACRHYWIIEPAIAPVSLGICRYCNEVKGFKNFIEGKPVNDDLPWVHEKTRIPITAPSRSHEDIDDP